MTNNSILSELFVVAEFLKPILYTPKIFAKAVGLCSFKASSIYLK